MGEAIAKNGNLSALALALCACNMKCNTLALGPPDAEFEQMEHR